MSNSDPMTRLNLVVLYARELEAMREFYETLGLTFVAERHGSGPSHYAATMGNLVLEIYPRRDPSRASPLRIGFQVSSIDRVIDVLQHRGVKLITAAFDSPWGRRATVEDPDGNLIELAEPLTL